MGGNRFGYLDLSGNVGVMNALIINLTRQIIELPPGTLASLNNQEGRQITLNKETNETL